jgi:membrane glycosyltransferase
VREKKHQKNVGEKRSPRRHVKSEVKNIREFFDFLRYFILILSLSLSVSLLTLHSELLLLQKPPTNHSSIYVPFSVLLAASLSLWTMIRGITKLGNQGGRNKLKGLFLFILFSEF